MAALLLCLKSAIVLEELVEIAIKLCFCEAKHLNVRVTKETSKIATFIQSYRA